jgi:hypothetical protein
MTASTMHEQPDRVIYRDELKTLLGNVCNETIRRYMAKKKLPPPDVAVSRNKLGWRLSTLQAGGIKLL